MNLSWSININRKKSFQDTSLTAELSSLISGLIAMKVNLLVTFSPKIYSETRQIIQS